MTFKVATKYLLSNHIVLSEQYKALHHYCCGWGERWEVVQDRAGSAEPVSDSPVCSVHQYWDLLHSWLHVAGHFTVIIMSFFDNIKEKGQDFINDIKENTDGIKDFIEDPSKIVEKGLNFVSQDGK